MATSGYIKKGESVLITGAAGVGKSFLATALAVQACRQGTTVLYFNMQKLLRLLKVARIEGSLIRLFDKLIVLNDFGLSTLDKQQQLDFMEIIEDRHAKKATIIASQFPVSSWFKIFSDETLADSVIDRIIYSVHRFELEGESMRRKKQ